MGPFANIEVLEPTSAERVRLRIRFQRLMNGLTPDIDHKRPPHPSTYTSEKYAEVARQAAEIIHDCAPRMEALLTQFAQEKSKPGLLFHDLAFEYDVPKPKLVDDFKLSEPREGGGLDGRTYFQHTRQGSFSDFFIMGVQRIIFAQNGLSPGQVTHGIARNSLARSIRQPYHRDNPLLVKETPRYSTLSCHIGNASADTHLLHVPAAIKLLSGNDRRILSEGRFTQGFGNTRYEILTPDFLEGSDQPRLNPFVFGVNMLNLWPGRFKGADPQAQHALDALVNALERNQDAVNLGTGDILLMDQKYLMHRGNFQLPLLGRSVTSTTFGSPGIKSYDLG